MKFEDFKFLSNASDQSKVLIAYHPQKSSTWYWAVYLKKDNSNFFKYYFTPKKDRFNQWNHWINIFWRWKIIFSFQDYHVGKEK